MQYTTLLLTSVATLALAQETIVTISEGLTTVLTLPAFPGGSTTTTGTADSNTAAPTADVTSSGAVTDSTSSGTAIPTSVNTDAQNSYISSLLSEALSSASSTPSGTLIISVNTTTTASSTGLYPISSGTGSYATYYPSGTGAVSPISSGFTGAASKVMGGSALALMVAVAGLVAL